MPHDTTAGAGDAFLSRPLLTALGLCPPEDEKPPPIREVLRVPVDDEGLYSYPMEAFSPECGTVTLQLFSEKNPKEPTIKVLKKETVTQVWADFEPWRQQAPR